MRDGLRISGLLAALLAVAAGPATAQSAEWYELSSRRQTDGVRNLDVDIDYVVGRLEVGPADSDLLYEVDLRYDSRQFEPVREWSAADGSGHLILRLMSDDHDTNYDIEDWEDVDSSELGSLEIGLSREIPTSLSLGAMAAETHMELGGLALERLEYNTAASETTIDFDAPNPVRMKALDLAAGAADFEANSLGNARFDELEFRGALGDVQLDFRGDWEGTARGDITMGVGSLELTFPRELGVRIEKDGFLSSFDDSGFEEVDGGYQTPNWETADERLLLAIRAGFGDIDVNFVD